MRGEKEEGSMTKKEWARMRGKRDSGKEGLSEMRQCGEIRRRDGTAIIEKKRERETNKERKGNM